MTAARLVAATRAKTALGRWRIRWLTRGATPVTPLLEELGWEHGHIGTRYLHCVDGEVKFDDGKKARFAAEKIFHVSLRSDADDKAHGAGPAIHEEKLARFVRAAHLGKPEEAGPVADVQRAAQDCVELGYVCAYQQDAQRALARYALEPMFEDEIRTAVIGDIQSMYMGLREQLALYDFTVFHGLPAPLLINEAPFIDWRVRARPAQPFVSLPLGPYCLLVGTPSGKKSRAGPVLWKTAGAMGPFKDHNRYVVESARLWLVATTSQYKTALLRLRRPSQRLRSLDRHRPGVTDKPSRTPNSSLRARAIAGH